CAPAFPIAIAATIATGLLRRAVPGRCGGARLLPPCVPRPRDGGSPARDAPVQWLRRTVPRQPPTAQVRAEATDTEPESRVATGRHPPTGSATAIFRAVPDTTVPPWLQTGFFRYVPERWA